MTGSKEAQLYIALLEYVSNTLDWRKKGMNRHGKAYITFISATHEFFFIADNVKKPEEMFRRTKGSKAGREN